MTVSTETIRSSHGWTGVETSFAPGWPADKAADVKGVFVTGAGVESALTQGVHFSVTLNASTKIVTCTPIAMPASSGTISFYRVTPATQAVDLQDGQSFPAQVHEDMHDRDAMRAAEMRDGLTRALVLTAGGTSYDLGGRAIVGLIAGTGDGNAVPLSQLREEIAAAAGAISPAVGAVTPPVLADVGKFWKATGVAAGGWTAPPEQLPQPVLADAGKALFATGAGAMAWQALRAGMFPLNLGLSAVASAGALTIALTTAAGAAPGAAPNSVMIPFRSATATDGGVAYREIAAANTLVLPSASTLGIPSGKPCKVHVIAFDDGGVVRLGAVVCKSGRNIMALAAHGIASSTAVSAAATSAQVIYTGVAVTSKPYTYLYSLEWSSGMTAGTWVNPTLVQPFGLGSVLPGGLVQAGQDEYRTNASSSVLIPIDDTIPQVTEGVQFASVALTAQSPANLLFSYFAGLGMPTVAGDWATVSLFLNGAANAVDATTYPIQALPYGQQLAIVGCTEITAAGVQTMTARFGPSGNAMRMNGTGTQRYLGGAMASVLIVQEIAA